MLHNDLVPNSQRDDFEPSAVYNEMKKALSEWAGRINKKYRRGTSEATSALRNLTKFVKGTNPSIDAEVWDRIYVTTLFTFDFAISVETINHYMRLVDDVDSLYVGGIMASLMPDKIIEATGIERSHILTGLFTDTSVVGDHNIYKGEETPGGMPQIVDDGLFERVQNILDRNKAAPARSRGKQEYLLTTKLFCGHCKEMMTGCTGTGKHGNKYHYYICNGAKKKVCDKKTIQKALIEERVVQACSELLTEEKVKYIADQVYAACKNDGDLLSVKRLKAALKEADSAIENLWVALEKGQSVDMITERIHKREAEKKELEKQLAIEIKKQSGMEYSVILSFLDYLRMLPNDNEYKRRALVNIFINAIYLYDGYFTMILNAGNRPLSIENIPLDDIEKTFENDDVGCSSNSQLVADAPPK